MIKRETVDRILDATRIEEVIGDFVSLKRRGPNYIGLCPFHPDKNPSMSVSSTKQIFKCFSCGKAGTAVTFLMEHEHLSYPDALRYLARKYNIEIEEKEETPEEQAARLEHESIILVLEFAQKYYQQLLWDGEKTHLIGLSYFKERKFKDDTIKAFGLGYAAPRQSKSFTQSALENGYKKEYLIKAGLSHEREDGSLVDFFYDRVMFPIYSLSGRVIAFGGRILINDKTKAKYKNSPETEVYIKNKSLYGIYQAKPAIAKEQKCYLVEGYTDVISFNQAGIKNVVASSGTALTVGQISLIKRFTENITLIYDGDAAGIKAAIRGTNLLLAEGMKVRVVVLPKEDDPDSFAKSHTLDEIQDYIAANENDFVTFKTNLLLDEIGNDPIKKANLINDIIETVSMIPDSIERDVYAGMVATKFNVKQESVYQKVKQLRNKRLSLERSREVIEAGGRYEDIPPAPPVPEDYEPVQPELPKEEPTIINTILASSEKELISYLVKYGEYSFNLSVTPHPTITVAEYVRQALVEDDLSFVNPIYKEMLDEYYSLDKIQDKDVDVVQGRIIRYFTNHQNMAIMKQALDIITDEHPITIKVYRESLVPEEQRLDKIVPEAVLLYKIRVIDTMISEIHSEIIKEAEKNGDSSTRNALTERLMLLLKAKGLVQKELRS